MRLIVPLAALLVIAAAHKPPAPQLLHALTEADQARIQETGCESAFTVGPRTYLFAMNNRMVFRTPTGPTVCNIDYGVLDAFFEEGRPITCRGMTLSLRHTGKRTDNSETDSVSGPASLTITHGSQHQMLRGESGTAC